ncbi:MAG: aminoglycoside 6'-N-acetyltransferase I [Oceanicoccus sp.]|jgi:aminoglycoside 6'-N-acetyltransferase I
MIFRNIEEKDIEACAVLFSNVFSSEPWNEPWTKHLARERLMHFYESKGFIGVLAESDGVNGFVLGNTEPFYFGSMFYLREMCIQTDLQKQGVGSNMFYALEKALSIDNVHSIYLTTEREIPAAEFYKKKGFKYSEKMGFYAKRTISE